MPWQEVSQVEIKKDLVLRVLEPGANKSELAREFGVSRKTLYKWLERFRQEGVEGLRERSRCPHERKVAASGAMVLALIELRNAHPTWGAHKLRLVALRRWPEEQVPSDRTVARILDRAGLLRKRRVRSEELGRRDPAAPRPIVVEPNDLWTFDFKGWWRTADGSRCEPLTVRDAASRYVLKIEVFQTPHKKGVRAACTELFARYGLPRAILVDNGSPFACTRARGGLSALSAWWVSLGIRVHMSRPAHPQDNGAHERLHKDLAAEVESSPARTLQLEQVALEDWRQTFNHVRPHDALDGQCPADLYRPSPRRHQGPRRIVYPGPFELRKVSANGCCYFRGHQVRVSKSLAGYAIGLLPIEDGVRVQFYELDLGKIDIPGLAA